jgi:hypothetical protein
MDIITLKTIAKTLPPHIAILMRGPTGIGKSYAAKAISEELNLPFIDVRGSTMDESDMGIPDLKASEKAGAYTKMVPSWYLRACREPVVLMLDELNRSMPQVMQGFFQIVLDRELGNLADGASLRLHPETRVIAAVNCGGEYDVNDMDPALLRRFWVTDIEPTVTDWIEWAKETELDSVLIEFVAQNPEHWRVDPASVEPGTVVPTPASWHRLSESLVAAELPPAKLAGTNNALLYPISRGFVGTEASIAFQDFVKNYERQISAEDVLTGKVGFEDFSDAEASIKLSIIDKLVDNCKDNKWKAAECKAVAKFGKGLGGEFLFQLWTKLSATNHMQNIRAMHKLVGADVVKVVQQSRNLANK